MKSLFFLLRYTLLLLMPTLASAVVLDSSTRSRPIVPSDFSIFIDSTASKDLQDIIATNSFSPGERVSTGNPEFIYWIQLNYRITEQAAGRFVLEFPAIHTDHIDVYHQTGQSINHQRSGQALLPKERNSYEVMNYVFDIPSSPGDHQIFLRITNDDYVSLDMTIRSQKSFTSYTTKEYYFLGIYYGILAIILLYNLLLFLTSKERTYAIYVCYVLSCMLLSFSDDGLGRQFLWPEHPEFDLPLTYYIAPVLFLTTFVLYSRSFLELKKLLPGFNKLLIGTTTLYLVYLPLEIWVLPRQYHLNFLYVVPFVIVYLSAIVSFVKGFKASRYFIVGYTFVFLSVVLIQLRNFQVLDPTPGIWSILLAYSFNIGMVLETIVLSIALGDRLRILKENHARAQENIIAQLEENKVLQEKVNRELEEKVAARTNLLNEKSEALSQANEQLKELTSQLTTANERLDYDNWKLNKAVKKETMARMEARELSSEEFFKLFPSDDFCLKYLEKLKWKNGFICRKCGHSNYQKRSKLLSRKCTKCQHIESAMASTVFQGMRFSLQKAFYIVYVTFQNSNLTVDELSETLDLNRNTAWKFRKKVSEYIAERKKASNWEELLINLAG